MVREKQRHEMERLQRPKIHPVYLIVLSNHSQPQEGINCEGGQLMWMVSGQVFKHEHGHWLGWQDCWGAGSDAQAPHQYQHAMPLTALRIPLNHIVSMHHCHSPCIHLGLQRGA